VFAESEQWRVFQERQDAILCLRPAKNRGLPIPLMHMAFCNFMRCFHEPLADEEYLTMANKLCDVMPSAFNSEDERLKAFEEIFYSDASLRQHREYSLLAKPSTVRESGGRVDVAKSIDFGKSHLVLLLQEFKNEIGNPYMQSCRTYEVLCGDEKNQPLLEFGNPAFLLCVLGKSRNVDPE
jgi:hypothetical protein